MAILTSDPRSASAYSNSAPCVLLSIHRDDYNLAIAKVHKREVMGRVSFLRRIHIFRGWSLERLIDFCKSLSSEVYGSGTVITKQGKESKGVYFIRAGRVRHLFRLEETKVVLEVGSLGRYEYFGERGLIIPGMTNY